MASKSLVREFFANLTPATMSVMDFAERFYKVKAPGALYYEPYDARIAPYLVRPTNLCSFYSGVRQIDFVKGVKIGGTVGLIFPVMIYNVMVARRNQYYVSADQKLIDEYVSVTVKPHFDAAGASRLIGLANPENQSKKNKKSGETSQFWQFTSGNYLKFCGANNANNFRQHEADFIILDERAAFPTFKDEGTAAELAFGRMGANKRGCALVVSTPKLAGSDYHLDYLSGTREKWLSPCPLCGEWQEMCFGEFSREDEDGERHLLYGLQYESENYQLRSAVRYLCRYCGGLWEEREKFAVNLASRWFALKPLYRHLTDKELDDKLRTPGTVYLDLYEEPAIGERHVSMQIEDTLCYFKTWENIAEEFLKAAQKGRPQDYQSFTNLHRGKFWEPYRRSRVDLNSEREASGYLLREVPEDVAFLTAWADVQGDYLDLGVYGWGVKHHSWVIDRIQIDGNPAQQGVWLELERIIKTMRWGQRGLYPAYFGIDEGGSSGWETIVLEFARRINYEESLRSGEQVIVVIPTKGSVPTATKNTAYRVSNAKLSGHGRRSSDELLHILTNTYYYKGLILGDVEGEGWLDRRVDAEGNKPFGYCHFPQDYKKSWMKQMRSEQKVIEIGSDGFEKTRWEKIHQRNESLDIFVGNAMLADYFMETQILPAYKRLGIVDWDGACAFMLERVKGQR